MRRVFIKSILLLMLLISDLIWGISVFMESIFGVKCSSTKVILFNRGTNSSFTIFLISVKTSCFKLAP